MLARPRHEDGCDRLVSRLKRRKSEGGSRKSEVYPAERSEDGAEVGSRKFTRLSAARTGRKAEKALIWAFSNDFTPSVASLVSALIADLSG